MHKEENALDLPEIRAIVGSFLARQDLIICAQVCHAWLHSFKPLIWRETILRSSQNPTRSTYLPPPPLEDFHRHGQLIRSLVLEGPVSRKEVLLGLGCTRLEHLRLSATIPVALQAVHPAHGNNVHINNAITINNSRRNNDDTAGPSNPVSTAGRWSLLLLDEADNSDDDGSNGGGGDSDNDQVTTTKNNSHAADVIDLDDDGESSEDSYWSSWNRSDDEDEDENECESDETRDQSNSVGTGGGRVDMWKSLAELVLQNRATLKELEIVLLSPPPCGIPPFTFWETVVECFPPPPPLSYASSTLTSLSLVGREIKSTDLMLIWRGACHHLTRLELARCSVENEAPLWGESVAEIAEAAAMVMETDPRPPSALQHLRLIEVRGMLPRTQFKVFIAASPKLNCLVWQLHRSHAGLAPRGLWVMDQDDYWQDYGPEQEEESLQQWLELTSLEVTSGKESMAVSDQQLSILLDRAGDTMERLSLGAVQVGEATLRSMRRFFKILGHLDLRLCSNVTGAMVQQVLASCPGLKSVAADSIRASDILDGNPWVCLDLQSWTVFVDLSVSSSLPLPSSSRQTESSSSRSSSRRSHAQGSRKQQAQNPRQAQKSKHNTDNNDRNNQSDLQELLQQCVFERLSTLTSLEHLDLDRHYPLTGRAALKAVETLDWRLKKGLDKLASLSRLMTVCLSSHQTMNMSKSAAVWMVEHWLLLEAVRGRLGERKADHKELARLFQQNGIHV
ncbi:MAG: hypothetical protein J3R72DRAFT_453033, partial [Linnemannia gamsii]